MSSDHDYDDDDLETEQDTEEGYEYLVNPPDYYYTGGNTELLEWSNQPPCWFNASYGQWMASNASIQFVKNGICRRHPDECYGVAVADGDRIDNETFYSKKLPAPLDHCGFMIVNDRGAFWVGLAFRTNSMTEQDKVEKQYTLYPEDLQYRSRIVVLNLQVTVLQLTEDKVGEWVKSSSGVRTVFSDVTVGTIRFVGAYSIHQEPGEDGKQMASVEGIYLDHYSPLTTGSDSDLWRTGILKSTLNDLNLTSYMAPFDSAGGSQPHSKQLLDYLGAVIGFQSLNANPKGIKAALNFSTQFPFRVIGRLHPSTPYTFSSTAFSNRDHGGPEDIRYVDTEAVFAPITAPSDEPHVPMGGPAYCQSETELKARAVLLQQLPSNEDGTVYSLMHSNDLLGEGGNETWLTEEQVSKLLCSYGYGEFYDTYRDPAVPLLVLRSFVEDMWLGETVKLFFSYDPISTYHDSLLHSDAVDLTSKVCIDCWLNGTYTYLTVGRIYPGPVRACLCLLSDKELIEQLTPDHNLAYSLQAGPNERKKGLQNRLCSWLRHATRKWLAINNCKLQTEKGITAVELNAILGKELLQATPVQSFRYPSLDCIVGDKKSFLAKGAWDLEVFVGHLKERFPEGTFVAKHVRYAQVDSIPNPLKLYEKEPELLARSMHLDPMIPKSERMGWSTFYLAADLDETRQAEILKNLGW